MALLPATLTSTLTSIQRTMLHHDHVNQGAVAPADLKEVMAVAGLGALARLPEAQDSHAS